MQNNISHHSPLAPPQSTDTSEPWYSCQGNRETRQPLPIQCTVHRTELERHKDKTWRDRTDSVENQKPIVWGLIPRPLPALPSSLPLHLDYSSCLIGLSLEDVPGVCQGEIAVVSPCPPVLAGMTWSLSSVCLKKHTWKKKLHTAIVSVELFSVFRVRGPACVCGVRTMSEHNWDVIVMAWRR